MQPLFASFCFSDLSCFLCSYCQCRFTFLFLDLCNLPDKNISLASLSQPYYQENILKEYRRMKMDVKTFEEWCTLQTFGNWRTDILWVTYIDLWSLLFEGVRVLVEFKPSNLHKPMSTSQEKLWMENLWFKGRDLAIRLISGGWKEYFPDWTGFNS